MTKIKNNKEPEKFAVEAILKARVAEERKKMEYLVKWINYDSDENSWEPAEGLKDCTRLIGNFWKHIGTDAHCFTGEVIEASEAWITKTAKIERAIAAEGDCNNVERRDMKMETNHNRREESTDLSDTSDSASEDNFSVKRKLSEEHESSDLPTIRIPPQKARKLNYAPVQVAASDQDITDVIATISLQQENVESSYSTPSPSKPSENGPSDSSLSTKQRLSQGALEAVPPKEISHSVSRPSGPPPPQRTSAAAPFISHYFKKKTTPTPVIPPSSLHSFSMQNPISSPMQMPRWSPKKLDPFLEGDGSLTVDNMFFQTLPEFSMLSEPVVEPPSFEPPPPIPSPNQMQVFKLPHARRQWTWSGNVFTQNDQSTPIFSVTFCDVVTSGPGGLGFEGLLPVTTDRLDFPAFHDAGDLTSILPACQGIHQWARLGPKARPDIEHLTCFSAYMAKSQMIILLPMLTDNMVIIIFNHGNGHVASQLKPTPEVQKTGSLVAALLLFQPTTSRSVNNYGYLSSKLATIESFQDEHRWVQTLRRKPLYHHALRMLNFPRYLYTYFADEGNERTFTIWDLNDGGGGSKKPGLETLALLKILSQCNMKQSSMCRARVIFLQVGSISGLHKLPQFSELCSSHHLVQFYTYGTHETVSPEFWGIYEVYPCGGIVTFTVLALIDDLIGVLHKIRQIYSHPLWDCYILPSVLGMATILYAQREGSNPIDDLERGKFPYRRILEAIEEGEISFIPSPSTYGMPSIGRNFQHEWLKKYWTHRPSGPRAILQASVDAFTSAYGNLQPTECMTAILGEISRDLRGMRCQPVFMKERRRYIVIDSPKVAPGICYDALEWTSTTKFDFKDDFFPQQ